MFRASHRSGPLVNRRAASYRLAHAGRKLLRAKQRDSEGTATIIIPLP